MSGGLFQHFWERGSGHSRRSGSCHFLSQPLTFGIVGRLPLPWQEEEERGASHVQGHGGKGRSEQSVVITAAPGSITVI